MKMVMVQGVGEFVIKESHDTDRHVGQTLVSDLINSPEVVNVNIGLAPNNETNIEFPAQNGNPIQIFIDPDNTTGLSYDTTWVQDASGNVMHGAMPAYITFGHELVHAWRDIKGIDIPSRAKIGLIPQDIPDSWREEELQTMGIDYTNLNGKPLRSYNSYFGIISENGLRLENRLDVRVSYRIW